VVEPWRRPPRPARTKFALPSVAVSVACHNNLATLGRRRQHERRSSQIHLWVGIALGVYVLVVCLTGSVLVYRNELYRAFSPQPVIVTGSGAVLTAGELTRAAHLAYPHDEVTGVRPGETPNHAVEITFGRGETPMRRLFHPFTGVDLGDPLPPGYRFTAWLLDLHDNLLSGPTGRRANATGALLTMLVGVTGSVVWWPGIRNWRRSLTIDVCAPWKILNWRLHSALGVWCLAFILMWGVSGFHLALPGPLSAASEWLETLDESNPARTMGDKALYWLTYAHFGRFAGRIPGCGAVCGTTLKTMWALVGLVPVLLLATGFLMWWNRAPDQDGHRG